jgi:hypothetical protein
MMRVAQFGAVPTLSCAIAALLVATTLGGCGGDTPGSYSDVDGSVARLPDAAQDDDPGTGGKGSGHVSPPEEAGASGEDAGARADGGAAPESDAAIPDGSTAVDASPPSVPDAAPPCTTERAFHRDADGDGYGSEETILVGCAAPAPRGWVQAVGDCDDADDAVHPGQKAFFGVPRAGHGGAPSYDYDCSGKEDPDPSQSKAPGCGLLTLGSCAGAGYNATSRTGTGLNSYCGSKSKTTCAAAIGPLVCEATTATTNVAYGCH